MSKTKSQGEDIGYSRIHRLIVAPVARNQSPETGSQQKRQVVPVGYNLLGRNKESVYH